jgi:hypothetical protein
VVVRLRGRLSLNRGRPVPINRGAMPRSLSPDVPHATEPAWLSLFNRRAFLAEHHEPGDAVVLLEHADDERVIGALGGVLRSDRLISGFSLPFAGLDFARPRETAANVEATVDAVLAQAWELGARSFTIRCRPAGWSANEDVAAFALLNRGFRVDVADLAYVIDLAQFADVEAYVAALKSPARRALRHALAEPYALVDSEDPERAYALLADNRASRGWTLSLSWERVATLLRRFPDELRVLELHHAGTPVAAAIVMSVRPDAWFVPAWGDANHALPRSPMNILAYRVVERALAAGVGVLDLGTSTLADASGRRHANPGLIQFKQSILATAQLRTVLVR